MDGQGNATLLPSGTVDAPGAVLSAVATTILWFPEVESKGTSIPQFESESEMIKINRFFPFHAWWFYPPCFTLPLLSCPRPWLLKEAYALSSSMRENGWAFNLSHNR